MGHVGKDLGCPAKVCPYLYRLFEQITLEPALTRRLFHVYK